MTAIERAEALLAENDLECTGVAYCTPCQRAERADSTIKEEAIATLRGYIGAVKALEAWESGGYIAEWKRLRGEAIADFERLFPEAPASAD